MPSFAFGKSLRFSFTPLADNTPVSPYSIVSARLYTDEPSAAQLADASDTSGVERVTTWIVGAEATERVITFSALTDPSPTSSTQYESYYVAINYLLESGGPEQYCSEVIYVYRADALTSRVTVTFQHLIDLEPTLGTWRTPAQLDKYIDQAKQRVFNKYAALGRELKRMFNLEKLNECVQFKAVALACWGLYSQNATVWKDKALGWDEAFGDAFTAAQVGYDVDGDDRPDPEETAQNATRYIIR